jgi:hypothetical protein
VRPPLVLLHQHPSQLRQRIRADIVERPQDALAILDRERNDLCSERQRPLEKRARRLIHKPDELANVLVGFQQASVPGRYTITLRALDASGLTSAPAARTFRR